MNKNQYRQAMQLVRHFLSDQRIATKDAGDIGAIAANYTVAFTGAVAAFLITHHNKGTLQEDLRNAIATFFLLAFTAGYQKASQGGADVDPEDQAWLDMRIAAELGFTAAFVERVAATDTEGKSEAELNALAASLSAGYIATLYMIYNEGLLRGNRHIMLTFGGPDGLESCKDCQRLKGRRERARWWIDNNLIPGQGGNNNYECRSWNCLHFLRTDDGEPYTQHG